MHDKAHNNCLDIDIKDFGEEEKKEFDTMKSEIRHRKLRIMLERQKKVGILPDDISRRDVEICFYS
jgi:hypothetical protein